MKSERKHKRKRTPKQTIHKWKTPEGHLNELIFIKSSRDAIDPRPLAARLENLRERDGIATETDQIMYDLERQLNAITLCAGLCLSFWLPRHIQFLAAMQVLMNLGGGLRPYTPEEGSRGSVLIYLSQEIERTVEKIEAAQAAA